MLLPCSGSVAAVITMPTMMLKFLHLFLGLRAVAHVTQIGDRWAGVQFDIKQVVLVWVRLRIDLLADF